MTLALVDLRLPIYLVIAIVLLFGLAKWLSWEDDQADGAKPYSRPRLPLGGAPPGWPAAPSCGCEGGVSDAECYWCGAIPPCPSWRHRDPDEADHDPADSAEARA